MEMENPWESVPDEENAALGRDESSGEKGLTLEDFRYWRDSLSSEWLSSVDGDEDSLDDQQAAEERLYFQHFTILSPEGKLAVKTGSAPSDADAAIDSLTPTDIQVRVRPARNRENHKKRAELVAKFGRGVVAEWRKQKDLARLVAGNMAIRRVGVMRVLFDARRWPPMPKKRMSKEAKEEFEWKKRKKFPVILESRNPRYTRWRQLDDGSIVAVVETYKTTVGEARIAYSAYDKIWSILAGRSPNDALIVADVWIGTERAIFIDDQTVLDGDGIETHGYRRPPYIIIPFRELPFDEPSRRYRGMLSNAAGLYEIESQVLTMHVWQLAWNSWRTWKGHLRQGRNLSIIPGEFVDIDPLIGEYIEMLEGEPVPPELLQTANIISLYIQRNGIAQGPSTQEGARSAQQVWAVQSIRQQKVEPGKQDLQRGFEQALTMAAEIVIDRLPGQKITLPVPGKDEAGDPIGEIVITSADLDGYEESFTVTFGRRLDPALLEQAKAMMTLWSNKWMPYQTSVELGGLTDSPDEWKDMLLLEAVDNLDFMKEIAGHEQLSQYYGADDWRTMTFQQRMQSMQVQSGQGNVSQSTPGVQPTAMPSGPAPGAQGQIAGPRPIRAGGRMPASPPPNVRGGGMPGQTGG